MTRKRPLARGWHYIGIGIVLGLLCGLSQTEAQPVDAASVAPEAQDGLIRDASGKVSYIVELLPRAAEAYPRAFQPTTAFQPYLRGEVVNLVRAMQSQYGFDAVSATSWSSTTFTAYLTDQQVDALSRDRRVLAVLPDAPVHFSDSDSTAVWTDSVQTLAAPPNSLWSARVTQSAEMRPWGKQAINQTTTSSNGTAIVYVVDAGVGQHVDLNVVEWVNARDHTNDCGTRIGVTCTSTKMPKLVACYTHSTAVAGIIGAKSNGTGIIGIDPGVKIVSVSILDTTAYPNTPTSPCVYLPTGTGAVIESTRVLAALDWVKMDIAANNHTGKPSVVNLSVNWGDTTQWPASGISMVKTAIANIALASPGAFVVQSAGNQFGLACTYAYGPKSSSDGIMVVGAINNHGQPVVPLNGTFGFWRELDEASGFYAHEPGSNYGSTCVDTWAPGDTVFSTAGPANAQAGNTTYNTYAYGGGTSFAAPHVAGLAAYLIETRALTTASQVETNINTLLFALGSTDPAGGAVKIPTLNPLPGTVPHNTPYAEFVLATACIWPPYATGTRPPNCKALTLADPSSEPGVFTPAARNRSTLDLNGATNVWMAFDSYGLGSNQCTQEVVDALGQGTTLHTGTNYYNPAAPIGGNETALSHVCPSASIGVVF